MKTSACRARPRFLPRPFLFALLACFVAASLLSGCATPQLDRLQQSERQGLPERAEVPAVPFFAQDEFYSGPAALAMTLAWSGLSVTEDDLVPMIYTPGRNGALRTDILSGARRYGRLAVPVEDLDALLTEIAAGNPVLVQQNLGFGWFPKWHYAVAVGYDLRAETITLNSGTIERLVEPLATFERTWARGDYWALVVTPPNRLAASADQTTAIVAANSLQRTGHTEDAVFAYEAIVERWPNSQIGWLALGNAHYMLRDYAHAEVAYRHATNLGPGEPESWNNLAVAVARQGRQREALAHAQRAIDVSGPRETLFRQTMAEIQQIEPAPANFVVRAATR